MIGSALNELVAAAAGSFPTKLAAIAAKYSITLVPPTSVQSWFSYETDSIQAALSGCPSSMMVVRWSGDAKSQLARPSAGVRDTVMPVIVSYLYKDTSLTAIDTHLKYVPEALLSWLDAFPIGSRSPGMTITKIAPPLGKEITIRQKKDDVREANGVVTYVWQADAEFSVEIRDVVP